MDKTNMDKCYYAIVCSPEFKILVEGIRNGLRCSSIWIFLRWVGFVFEFWDSDNRFVWLFCFGGFLLTSHFRSLLAFKRKA